MTVENMRFAKKQLLCAAGAIIASVLTACGSGSTTTPSNVRLVNLIPATSSNATLDTVLLALDSTAYGVSAAPATASAYVQVTPATYDGALEVNDPSIAPDTFPGLGLATNQYYSVLAYSRSGVLYPFELIDDIPAAPAGEVELSVANASPDVGAVDVYLAQHSSSSPANPCANVVLGSATFQNVQGQQTIPVALSVLNSSNTAITYDVCVMEAQSVTDPRFSVTGVSMASTGVYTLALTSSTGGTLVDAALIQEGTGGTVKIFPSSNFRIRVLSALSGNGNVPPTVSVTTSLGTTTLPPAYTGEFPTYTSIGLGATATTPPAVSVTVGALAPIAASLPSGGTFAPGADYTVLVYGPASAPVTTIFVDNNHYLANKAAVRLINAADPASGLEMAVQSQGVAYNVGLGTASAYYAVAPGPDTVTLYSPDLTGLPAAAPVTPAGGLTVGGIYTVFLYSLQSPPLVIEDR